jgi:hypothetical protein
MGQKFELDRTSHDRLMWAAGVVKKSTQDAWKMLDALQKDFERALKSERLEKAGQLQWKISFLTEHLGGRS